MFEEILRLKRQRQLDSRITNIINKAINIALENSLPAMRGLRLAAIFDLLASIEYYNSATNRGWIYCPEEPPLLLYPYTNICPRCLGKHVFKFAKANKPESGKIGTVTSEILCYMLEALFRKFNRNVEVFKASEPIDAVIYDRDANKIIVAEVKSAPMMTLPLAVYSDRITESIDGELVYITDHSVADNPMFRRSQFYIYMPQVNEMPECLIPLQLDWDDPKPFWRALEVLTQNPTDFFEKFFAYWEIAYSAYSQKDKSIPSFWLTNGCGQPHPRPLDWPNRRGSGYESVSDAKTSVGMDRTDDIKKAIYQVLKLGSEYKPHNNRIKTAIVSNIHAVRHYDEYLLTVRDIIWAIGDTQNITLARELSPETPIYNLFDGILSFTRSEIRDEWISSLFNFEEDIHDNI